MLILAGLGLIVALTAATAYFVAQEFAYVAADRSRLAAMAADGDRRATRALSVTSRLSFMLSGAQLGITVTALLAGYVAEPYLGQGLADLLGLADVPRSISVPVSVAVALLVATVVQMVLGELAPKNLAIARPETLAKALAASTRVYLAVAGPLIRLFDTAANRLLRAVGIEPIDELTPGATADDLVRIVADARAGGHLDDATAALLDRGLDFRTLTAGQAMVPRVNVITVHATDPATRVVELLDTGHTRFPVLGEGADDVIGIVGVPDLLAIPADRRATPLTQVAVAPLQVPAGLSLPRVLERLRATHRQMACVVDEYGGFAGIITLEDVAEELVGPIRDEDDLPEPAPNRLSDGSWRVPARWRVDEIADATGIPLPVSGDYDTVSGLIMRLLGRIPQRGDTVTVDLPASALDATGAGRVTIEVLNVDRHVPDTVHLSLSETS
ncbi:MAG TPA: hemolysin family protein [Micromonosporaceae bacterium]